MDVRSTTTLEDPRRSDEVVPGKTEVEVREGAADGLASDTEVGSVVSVAEDDGKPGLVDLLSMAETVE